MNTESPPEPVAGAGSQLAEFRRRCAEEAGPFATAADFDRFAVDRFRDFWRLFLEWSDPPREGDPEPVCTDDRCELAAFFPDLRLNYAECLLDGRGSDRDGRVALIARHGDGSREELTRAELRDRVRRLAGHLQSMGVQEGDRVAAIAANDAEAAVAALAVAALGATFSSAAPEMATPAVLSRFEQLAPKLLMAVGDPARVTEVAAALPSLQAVLKLDDEPAPPDLGVPVAAIGDLLAAPPPQPLEPGWRRFPFNHPLFVLFTSGTTGAPKCIVHSAGGTLLEHLKEHRLHLDLDGKDTLFFHTSAAWMMWNWQLSALATGARVVVYDGPLREPGTLWEIVAAEEVTVFGTSPPYLQLCQDAGYSPRREAPAPALRSVLSTGSVLRDWQFDWVAEEVGPVKLQSISGGTDIIGCFVLGHPELPVRRGLLQCRSLGLDVRALPSEETPAGSAVGELICCNPFPSRPLGFLGDEDGSRFHAAYFAQNDGVWTHGDLIEFDDDGQARIHGRSDGVLNIQGVRIGPSEIYQALGDVPEVSRAMAVEQRNEAGSRLVLLVVLREGAALDAELVLRIRRTIGAATTALHVPQLVVAVDELPVTHSGKLSEKAGRAAVEGRDAANRRALANPASLERIREAVIAAETALDAAQAAEPGPNAPTLDRVRAIWEAVLAVEGLRPDDDFFVLGGTSLQAVRVFTLIRERIGPDLPLSVLIDAPTIAELTAVVEAPDRPLKTIVPIRAGSGAPLFFAHSIWGDVVEMRQVATAMRADASIFGLRARGLAPGEERQDSVEEMAESYVEAILEWQPVGPYRVAGYSFGGLLAYEIACRLTARGEEVGWLGLIDAELSAACLPPALRWRRRAALPFHVGRAAAGDPGAALRAARQDVLPKLIRRRTGEAQREAAFADSHAAWMDEASPAHQRIATAFLEAADAYRPGPYPGSLTYFLPTVRRLHLFPDPLPVWRRLAVGGVEVVRVPGPHVGMVSGEAAQVVARRIDAALSP